MTWLAELFFGEGTPHSILVLALVIAAGLALAQIKVKGVSIGSAWILFVGILVSSMGLLVDPHTLHFVREFGLVLFIFSIGLQVGPSFGEALKKGGLTLNLLATGVVMLGVGCTLVLYAVTGVSPATMVGIMSGAVTNTPGLGAAQQTALEVTGQRDATIAAGYAMAYPLAVVGIIASIVLLRRLCGVDLEAEARRLVQATDNARTATRYSLLIENPAVHNKTLSELRPMLPRQVVISRILHRSHEIIELVDQGSTFHCGDRVLVVANRTDRDFLETFFGQSTEVPEDAWRGQGAGFDSRRVLLSRGRYNGVSLAQLGLRSLHGVNVTRVNRAGVDLVASPDLRLQVGDRLTIVGAPTDLRRAERLMGNSSRTLDAPNLLVVFLGVTLGVIVGSIPFAFPGIPQPVKLGMAGGPLIVALLLGRFGPALRLVTYSTASANLMMREVGMALFLAGIGLGAGETFIATVLGGGYMWVLWGLVITLVPVLTIGVIALCWLKVNYYTLIGVLAGATTDPPALAYAQSVSNNDAPAVGYATVYPLAMFLRVIAAQVLIIVLVR